MMLNDDGLRKFKNELYMIESLKMLRNKIKQENEERTLNFPLRKRNKEDEKLNPVLSAELFQKYEEWLVINDGGELQIETKETKIDDRHPKKKLGLIDYGLIKTDKTSDKTEGYLLRPVNVEKIPVVDRTKTLKDDNSPKSPKKHITFKKMESTDIIYYDVGGWYKPPHSIKVSNRMKLELICPLYRLRFPQRVFRIKTSKCTPKPQVGGHICSARQSSSKKRKMTKRKKKTNLKLAKHVKKKADSVTRPPWILRPRPEPLRYGNPPLLKSLASQFNREQRQKYYEKYINRIYGSEVVIPERKFPKKYMPKSIIDRKAWMKNTNAIITNIKERLLKVKSKVPSHRYKFRPPKWKE